LGHHRDVVVQLGREGISDSLVGAVDQALATHELVKVRVGQNAPEERHQAAAALAERTRSEVVQVLGDTILLYRAREEEPGIELP
jgi:RNA-binding protein